MTATQEELEKFLNHCIEFDEWAYEDTRSKIVNPIKSEDIENLEYIQFRIRCAKVLKERVNENQGYRF